MIIFIFIHQVEQLSETTGEESIILTASVSDGTLSHLGSESGKSFLDGHDEIKSQFLGFVLKSKSGITAVNVSRANFFVWNHLVKILGVTGSHAK